MNVSEFTIDEIALLLSRNVAALDPDDAAKAKEILTTFFAARLDEIEGEISEIEKSYRPGDGDDDDDITYYFSLSALELCSRPLADALCYLHPMEGDEQL